MRVAVVHHWFVTRGGGERVAAAIASLFPTAELFTLVATPEGLPFSLQTRKLHTSFLQRIPGARSHHRHMLPLYPAATESLDLRGFGLILSSDSGPIKGVRHDPGATHLCYCHSPMRYLYDGFASYRSQMNAVTGTLFAANAGRVRRWDQAAGRSVTQFVANSTYVAARIRKVYGRESAVIPPPIDLQLARTASQPGEHYLCAGRLVSYKRTELMIEACRTLGRKLRIAGTGPEMARLRRIAGVETEFLGPLPDEQLWQEYATCHALLFAADEDFGMVPLEAQACGRPVIAYGAGGSLETVIGTGDEPTGIFFAEQTTASLAGAIERFEANESRFSSTRAQSWANHFSTPIFLERMRAFILAEMPSAIGEMAPIPEMIEL